MPPRPAVPPPGFYHTLLLLGAGGLLGALLSLQLARAVTELRRSRQLLQQVLTELRAVEDRSRDPVRSLTRPPGTAPGPGSGLWGRRPLPARPPQPTPVIVL